MKKILSLVLALLLALALVGCGSSPDTESSDGSGNISTDGGKSPDESSGSQGPVSNDAVYSFVDEVIVDNEHFTFTITGVDADSAWGFTVKALCENKSDKNLMFSWDNVSVNGYMSDPFWASTVAAGKKSNEEIRFSKSSFDAIGIAAVEEIVFWLSVYDSDDWTADKLADSEYAIYPTGLSSDSVAYSERAPEADDIVIVDNERCTFIIMGAGSDNAWGYTLNCYLVNKTSAPLMFSWDNVSVNGYMIDPFWADLVASGKRSFSEISFSSSGFEENGIEFVSEIEFELRAYDSNDWTAPDVIKETFTYNP